ncbi:hypothetical protein ABFS83_02G042700 [Erythranthe nasuta]
MELGSLIPYIVGIWRVFIFVERVSHRSISCPIGVLQPLWTTLICAFKQIEESCHRLPTTEDKRKLESVIRSLQSLETSTGKVTSSIIDVLLKTGDSQLEMPSLQRRNYMFGGLNHGAKTKLIECLTQSLGESFFTYIKLHDNYRGGKKEKASLMGKVNKNPCLVVFVDGVEFADDIFYKSVLDIFDNGVLEDCKVFGVEFRRSIIIFTSENSRRVNGSPILEIVTTSSTETASSNGTAQANTLGLALYAEFPWHTSLRFPTSSRLNRVWVMKTTSSPYPETRISSALFPITSSDYTTASIKNFLPCTISSWPVLLRSHPWRTLIMMMMNLISVCVNLISTF